MLSPQQLQRQKLDHLTQLAQYRDELRRRPRLRFLFLELTRRCNLSCLHCGSSCTGQGDFLDYDAVLATLNGIASRKNPKEILLCLTGGEPLLYPRLEELIAAASRLGFPCGITTNATLLDQDKAMSLRRAGLATASVSLDGLEDAHDALRRRKGSFAAALKGIAALKAAELPALQITTVVSALNLHQLEAMAQLILETKVDSWRLTNVEPMGRALDNGELALSPGQLRELLEFIRRKRFDPDYPLEVCYGCAHFLPLEYERIVRPHYFLCESGLYVASITQEGDIVGCLDVERRPELVQGNIHRDDFLTVWEKRFLPYRTARTAQSPQCAACPQRQLCGGDSMHSWDFDRHRPRFCHKELEKY